MPGLFRFLTVAFFVWLVCHFFYSLGKKAAARSFGQRKENQQRSRDRKFVESSLVEENDNDNDGDNKSQPQAPA